MQRRWPTTDMESLTCQQHTAYYNQLRTDTYLRNAMDAVPHSVVQLFDNVLDTAIAEQTQELVLLYLSICPWCGRHTHHNRYQPKRIADIHNHRTGQGVHTCIWVRQFFSHTCNHQSASREQASSRSAIQQTVQNMRASSRSER